MIAFAGETFLQLGDKRPMNPTSLVAYLALFVAVGFSFLCASLILGRFLRPRIPSPQKAATYECGEPTIGSSRVQFDLRFYVVALVFLIFDVEVAFLFPWATVFGIANVLGDSNIPHATADDSQAGSLWLDPATSQAYHDLGVSRPSVPLPEASALDNSRRIVQAGRQLGAAAMADMIVFFAVLLVGFAYVWTRGDLDWVRAAPRRPTGAGEPDRLESTFHVRTD
jgi:NADH-quinone oxidoreductase subunit A